MKSLSPYDLKTKFYSKDCTRISVNELVESIKPKIKEELLKLEMNASGINIELTTSKAKFGGERFWFTCPLCGSRKGLLYISPTIELIGCKNCLQLKHET